jgi:hypothetical protein
MKFPAFPGMVKNRSQSEINAFVGAMQGAGLDPVSVAAAIEFESAGSWSPAARNASSGATGLIQFMPSTAKQMGTSTEALAQLSFVGQLQWVLKYFQAQGISRLKRLVDTYAAVFWPAAIGTSADHVIAVAGSPAYDQNKALDPKGNGQITTGDLDAVMQAVLAKANANGVIDVTPTSSIAGPHAVALGAALAVLAVGTLGLLIWRKAHT